MKNQIITAIKTFDISKLEVLLDDSKPYMDVSKSLFLKTLEAEFEKARKNDCSSFDDVFFGVCGYCNKGCEGVTFLSETGYYLDLFFESKEDGTVDDIYVCNQLTNFVGLNKTMDLGFSFGKDEEVGSEPSEAYNLIARQYRVMLSDLNGFEGKIKIENFVRWYDNFQFIRTSMKKMGMFRSFKYKLYTKTYDFIFHLNHILAIKTKADHAIDALISYHQATTEREKVI